MSKGARRLALFCAVSAAVVALDQATKAAVRAALEPGEAVTLIPGVMDLKLVYNTGAAFSMGEGKGLLFVLFCAVVVVASAVFAYRRPDAPVALTATLGCIAGGGVGNAIDRIAAGRVTDFFATTFVDFAVFNVADIFITCGVFVALHLYWRYDAAER